jgi:hypothetical protein
MLALMNVPAVADRYEESDPSGDMAVQSDRTGEISTFSGHRSLDIRHVPVRHTDHFVLVRVITRALTRPRAREGFALFGIIKVDKRAQPSESAAWTWETWFDVHRPREGGSLFILDAEHQEQFGCDGFGDQGLKARANYDRDRVTMMIPRRCLALQGLRVRPAWVQAFVTTAHGGRKFYYDHLDAPARVVLGGQFNSSYNRWLTPRLYPG